MEQNSKQKTNVSKLILRTIIMIYALILLITTLFVLACTVKNDNLSFGKYQFYIMKTDEHSEFAEPGSLVIVREYRKDEVAVGDYIVYGDGKYYYCNNVLSVNKNNIIKRMIFAEKDGIKYQFDEDVVEGKIVKVIPKVGNIIKFFRTPIGIVIFVIFTVCLFVLLRVIFTRKKDDEKQKDNYTKKEENVK